MNLVVTTEHRFACTPDGAIWTQTMFAYPFWTRYLEIFDRVRVVARVLEVPSIPPDWQRADGEKVTFASIPHYIGLGQYLLKAKKVQCAARNAVGKSDAVILRLGSQIATCIEPMLRQTGHPYGVEVVSDPADAFAPGAIEHPLSPFFRWWFPRLLQNQCAGACGVAYVTERALQLRYPPARNAFSTHCSDVELPDVAFVPVPRLSHPSSGTMTLVNVGSMAQTYKGQDVLIDAVAACIQERLDIKLILIGDGKHRSALEARVAKLGIEDRVCFFGQISAGDAVRTQLDRADLFILPSKTEGMPRAMLEAMARGLPCIGSTVGGIPELLPPEDTVLPGDITALKQKILEVLTNPERLSYMSARNLEKAKEYRDEILHQRRNEFYRQLRERTKAWREQK
ncbi:glycosyl transferase family 1 [Chroococcidiopsis sp. CCALA 051]|uniref:glycosyltransferase n=1 Tax=Chroococcidiopsis sp. CCALA 051 TaxID=869949 RepID=UPI000D0C977F|nr:glycosyltransferase family 4 protein [Chroococcidiopsis sp. CCALA 051]MBE9015943.1 glycosyltransferase family 4 protein [Chroococcidiopsidales cyanobacterium LEGE 13417]PSM48505.1 glycosyl transferase family 1 [Chroococcidiopsis sp. CCALA 051]